MTQSDPELPVRHSRQQPFRSREADTHRATKLGELPGRSLPRHGQPDFAAEGSETRIVLPTQDEGIDEEIRDERWVAKLMSAGKVA